MPREVRVPVEGGELAVTDYGGPGRAVVLVHSAGYASDVWMRFAPLLAQHTRVLAVDLRGHGQSTCELRSVDQLISDFERLVAELDLRCPIIVGHQYGGGIAAAVVAARPWLWGGLCVIDSPVTGPQADYLDLLAMFHTPEMLDDLADRFLLGEEGSDDESYEKFTERAAETMADDWLSFPGTDRYHFNISRMVLHDESGHWERRPTRRTLANITAMTSEFPLVPGRELLTRSASPVWVLQPTNGDYGQGFDEVAQMAEEQSRWAARRVRGDAFVAVSRPRELCDALVELLAQLPPQGPLERAATGPSTDIPPRAARRRPYGRRTRRRD